MDDDSKNLVKGLNILTASNESETFDSWTLVSDALKPKQSSTDVIVASEANENESSGVQHVENEEDSNKNHDIDDLSDGISIISECESAGRLSPTTTITSTTSTLTTALPSNLNDGTTINNENHNRTNNNNELLTPPTTPKKYRSPHHITSESVTQQDRIAHYVELISSSSLLHDLDRVHNDDNEEQQLTVPSTSNTASSSSSLSSCPITKLLSFIRFPISKIFIISSLILLISFFGNIKLLNNTNWSSLSTNIPQLFERIENLELQNNLLRAEIDILSKNLNSINYYNNRREKYQKDDKQKFNSNPNDEDKIKWKNDDKNYDNNENKNNRKKEQIIIQKDENFIKKSNINEKTDIPLPPTAIPKNDDKNSLSLENESNNGPVINDDNNSNQRSKQNQNENESNLMKSDDGKDFKKKYDNNSKDNYENKKYDEKIKYDKYNKYEKKKFGYDDDDDDDDDDDSKERTNSKEYYDKKKKYEKNEKNFKKYHDYDDDDDDHDDDNDSKERKNYKYDKKHSNGKEKYDSREKEYYGKRKNGEKENVSKEKKGGGGRDKYNKNNDDKYKDDWHEKMMQHREESRKAKYDNNNNWYIERGKGREETRIFEKNN